MTKLESVIYADCGRCTRKACFLLSSCHILLTGLRVMSVETYINQYDTSQKSNRYGLERQQGQIDTHTGSETNTPRSQSDKIKRG